MKTDERNLFYMIISIYFRNGMMGSAMSKTFKLMGRKKQQKDDFELPSKSFYNLVVSYNLVVFEQINRTKLWYFSC